MLHGIIGVVTVGRWFALSFIPALAAVTFTFINAVQNSFRNPFPMLGIAFTFIAAQLLHFALIRRTLRR